MSVKILAFPIFRRYWLYHAWSDAAAEAAQSAAIKDWRKGINLEEKLSLLGTQASAKVALCLQLVYYGACCIVTSY